MGKSKVIYNDETLIDLSEDTVAPENLDEGVTAHNSNGDPIVGNRPKDADTVDGWHFDVRLDGSDPPEGITDTISLIFTVGG